MTVQDGPRGGRERLAQPVTDVQDFRHLHASHCESGVAASLFRHAGHPVSEPLLFGIGGGIFFAHFSFIKVMGVPLTTFRSMPGSIFSRACTRLGVTVRRERFRRPAAGMRRLDQLLEQGRKVGLQCNIFWLPYIPRAMRVHFNGHNLVVLERRGDDYVVSDPVMEDIFLCPARDLQRARFTGGPPLLTRGLLYHPDAFPSTLALRPAVEAGLAQVCRDMRKIPGVLPWMGLQGITHLGRQLPRWAREPEDRQREWVAGLVRMQEEIGTGGAGFRYLYAAFLQQAGDALAWPELAACAPEMSAVGDQWRRFALHASRFARGKADRDLGQLGELMLELGQVERAFFDRLDRVRRGGPPLLGGAAQDQGTQA